MSAVPDWLIGWVESVIAICLCPRFRSIGNAQLIE